MADRTELEGPFTPEDLSYEEAEGEEQDAEDVDDSDNIGNVIESPREYSLNLAPGINTRVLPAFTTIDSSNKRRPMSEQEIQERLDSFDRQINDVEGILVGVFMVDVYDPRSEINGKQFISTTTTSRVVYQIQVPRGPEQHLPSSGTIPSE